MGVCCSRYFGVGHPKSSTLGRVSRDVVSTNGDIPRPNKPVETRSPSSELLADTAAILSLAESHGLNDEENTLEANPAEDDSQTGETVTTLAHPASPTRGVVWSLDQGSVVRTAIASLQAAQHPLASVNPTIISPRGRAQTEAESSPSPFSRVAARIRAIESTPSYSASPSVRSPRLSLPDFLKAHEPGSGQGFSLFSDPGNGSASPRGKAIAQLHASQEHDTVESLSAVPAAAGAGRSVGSKRTPGSPEACVGLDGVGQDITQKVAAATAHAATAHPATAHACGNTAIDSVLSSDQSKAKLAVAAGYFTSMATITSDLEPGACGVALAGPDDVMVVVDRVLEEIVDYINAVGAETVAAFGFGTVTASDDDAVRQPSAGKVIPETDMLGRASGSEEQDDVLVKASGRFTLVCLDSSIVNAHDNSPKRQVIAQVDAEPGV